MGLIDKVETLLKSEFSAPGDKVVLEEYDSIYGYVISSRFEGMDTMSRIDIIREILDRGLTKEERRDVLTIVALTPLEEIAHSS